MRSTPRSGRSARARYASRAIGARRAPMPGGERGRADEAFASRFAQHACSHPMEQMMAYLSLEFGAASWRATQARGSLFLGGVLVDGELGSASGRGGIRQP